MESRKFIYRKVVLCRLFVQLVAGTLFKRVFLVAGRRSRETMGSSSRVQPRPRDKDEDLHLSSRTLSRWNLSTTTFPSDENGK